MTISCFSASRINRERLLLTCDSGTSFIQSARVVEAIIASPMVRRTIPLCPSGRRGEGRWAGVQRSADGFQDTLQIVQHLVVPETNDAVAALRELGAAAFIGFLAKRVLTAVQLDRQLSLGTGESGHAPTDRMLAAEFPSRQPLAQGEPQN